MAMAVVNLLPLQVAGGLPLRRNDTSILIAIVQFVPSKNGTIGSLALHFCIVRVEQ